MPRYAEELAKSHDDDGQRTVHVTSRYDSRSIMLDASRRRSGDQDPFSVLRDDPPAIVGEIEELKAQQATYIPPDHPTAPLKGGWLVRQATINSAARGRCARGEPRSPHAGRRPLGFPPPYVSARPARRAGPRKPSHGRGNRSPPPQSEDRLRPHTEIAYFASLPPFPLCVASRNPRGSTISSIAKSN